MSVICFDRLSSLKKIHHKLKTCQMYENAHKFNRTACCYLMNDLTNFQLYADGEQQTCDYS